MKLTYTQMTGATTIALLVLRTGAIKSNVKHPLPDITATA